LKFLRPLLQPFVRLYFLPGPNDVGAANLAHCNVCVVLVMTATLCVSGSRSVKDSIFFATSLLLAQNDPARVAAVL